MYKNLKHEIKILENTSGDDFSENEHKILLYKKEISKIVEKFPENFFENYLDE